ncbi:MAG: M23 family metallopeptidase [Candidatus Muiribacteriota bacterium]|jgi:murein DD-endopeptidase MepM/ murein hydrolase activator NlpD
MFKYKLLICLILISGLLLTGCEQQQNLSQSYTPPGSSGSGGGSGVSVSVPAPAPAAAAPATTTASTNGRFAWPTQTKRMSSPYGMRTLNGVRRMHGGIDLAAPTGHAITAPAAGRVTLAQWSSTAGNWIIIQHGDGRETVYMHCHRLNVRRGENVRAGQVIATVGNTGASYGAHLHFEIRRSGEKLDPPFYMVFASDLRFSSSLAKSRLQQYTRAGYNINNTY